jgi:hypothetical protein
MPRSLYPQEIKPVPIVEEAGWAPRPIWKGAEYLAPPTHPQGLDARNVQPEASRYTNLAIMVNNSF